MKMLLFLSASLLLAEDSVTPKPEMVLLTAEQYHAKAVELQARVKWLEEKLAATEQKSRACFDIYGAEMKLVQLKDQEPKEEKKTVTPKPVAHKKKASSVSSKKNKKKKK